VTGAWVTWPADVLTRPDIADITPHLDAAVEALRWHRDIIDATYDYTPGARTVTLRLLVRDQRPASCRVGPIHTAGLSYSQAL
jgi:hypothetical protein